ncbi:MAG: ABC transporter substrate-binding protein [Alphaproteobacteria bacterium]|nr:ABC transporter substrate-binding protein [Alphaproteobacteria bacterium]
MIRAPQIFAAAAILAILVAGCDEQESLTPINVKLNWQHGADFIGFYVARNKGYFEEEGLEVTIHALSEPAKTKDMFEAVAAAEFEFSLAGGSLAEAQARGLPLVAIANINKFSPATLFARRESEIVTPADLAGKRIAVKNDNWRGSIEELLQQFDLSFENVIEVPAGFDMKPFFDGEVDVWAGFIQDEPVRARLAGLDIVTLPLHEYGKQTAAMTIFTHRDIVRDSPGMATNFIRATLRGWQWAIENPEMAVGLLIEERPELGEDREFQIASLLASVPLIIPPGAELGAIDCAEWLADPLLAGLPGKKELCTEQLFANATGRAGQ